MSFHIARQQSHLSWNRRQPPAVTVPPGTTVTLEAQDASGGQLSSSSRREDLLALDFSRVNPVTGPICVEGAEPGDDLVVEILDIAPGSWGWTASIPGFGLLADLFPGPELVISRPSAHGAEIFPGLLVPVVPFIGTIGVAQAAEGDFPLVPPSAQGGNMDVRHITRGARLHLPVAVPGALLSAGDTHAAQGDGEVCGTAIEVASEITLRLSLEKGRNRQTPFLESAAQATRSGEALVTTGIGPDLFAAARQATIAMIEEVVRRTALSDVEAYLLASVAADLHVSEIVDVPNWVVSMHLTKAVLG